MDCPGCQNPLVPQKLAGITADVCRSCIGIWFDPGEFGAYGRVTGTPLAEALDGFQPDGGGLLATCPRCLSSAVEAGHARAHRLLRCSACTGVFVQAAEGAPGPDAANPQQRLSVDTLQRLSALLHGLLDPPDAAAS